MKIVPKYNVQFEQKLQQKLSISGNNIGEYRQDVNSVLFTSRGFSRFIFDFTNILRMITVSSCLIFWYHGIFYTIALTLTIIIIVKFIFPLINKLFPLPNFDEQFEFFRIQFGITKVMEGLDSINGIIKDDLLKLNKKHCRFITNINRYFDRNNTIAQIIGSIVTSLLMLSAVNPINIMIAGGISSLFQIVVNMLSSYSDVMQSSTELFRLIDKSDRHTADPIPFSHKQSIKLLIDKGIYSANGNQNIMIIRGTSGAGKSTLLSEIAGLQQTNRVLINDNFNAIMPCDFKRNRIYIPQYILELFSDMRKIDIRQLLPVNTDAWINCFGLDKVITQQGYKPKQISGGEKHRLFTASILSRAFNNEQLGNIKLLLIDEPDVGLKKNQAKKVIRLLHEICLKNNILIVMIIHDETLVPYIKENGWLLDELVIMDDQTIINCDDLEDLDDKCDDYIDQSIVDAIILN
jgi:ABC-type lipoprotein export system ATPase subunit